MQSDEMSDFQVLNTLTPFPVSFRGAAVTIGKFDGVHLGHVAILRETTAQARRRGIPAIAVTFDPPPLELLRPHFAPPPLCTLERKIELLEDEGVDAVCVVPTTRELLEMSAEAFFRQILVKTFAATVLVEGETFTFGHGREGNAALLRRFGVETGIDVSIIPPVFVDERVVSSSRLRHLIKEGDVDAAAELMTRPYRLSGTVVPGAHRGRTLGFPTANLGDVATLLPRPGLYGATVRVAGADYRAAVHIGTIPTFEVPQTVIEAHLIDFDGVLYGEVLDVDLHIRLRDVLRFDTPEALVARMQEDIRKIRLMGP